MNDHLHIVCLDAPSPPDYGGAIDMHYKIKALADVGKKIILHYFNYKSGRSAAGLENICVEINSYTRGKHFSLSTPYIILSRVNKHLIERLNRDEHPILLEGLHCAGIIPHLKVPERVLLRMHNEEAAYYQHLADNEKSFIKKAYYHFESTLLNKYQQGMNKQLKIVCLSTADLQSFSSKYHFQDLHFVPCFLPWQNVNIKAGKGGYCLYHGNLSVSENEAAALWLIENVFSKTEEKFVVAGRKASGKLFEKSLQYKNVEVVTDPSTQLIDQLIAGAQINILPSMNATGVKLKLLHALLRGRFCITNKKGIEGSEIESAASIADSPDEYLRHIHSLMQQDFTPELIQKREKILYVYNNKASAEKLSALL